MKVISKRDISDNSQTLSTGQVINDDNSIAYDFNVLELPWKDNQHGISCIPAGTYRVVKSEGWGNIKYPHFAFIDVPGRSGICAHIGNYAAGVKVDSEGCLLVGKGEMDINKDGHLDIINSGVALKQLLDLLPNEFEWTIE